VFRRKLKERKTEIDAELEPLDRKAWQAYEQCNIEFRKQERYRKEQREVLRALQDLKESEREMYLLDNLCPFNDRALNRDLAVLRDRVNQASPHLPDGCRLSFTVLSTRCILLVQERAKLP
jgi:hypothetical protein